MPKGESAAMRSRSVEAAISSAAVRADFRINYRVRAVPGEASRAVPVGQAKKRAKQLFMQGTQKIACKALLHAMRCLQEIYNADHFKVPKKDSVSAATDRLTAFPYKLPKSYGTKLQGTTRAYSQPRSSTRGGGATT